MTWLKIALMAAAALVATAIMPAQITAGIIVARETAAEAKTDRTELQSVASTDAQTCVRLKQTRPSAWDIGEEKYRQFLANWIEICQRAVAIEPTARVKLALFNALFAADRRPEAIAILRGVAATGDIDALVEIYEWHKSWERGDVDKVQIVNQTEAGEALRKAAELGNPFAMYRLALLLERGDIVKRDNASAIYWAERALRNPDKDSQPEDIATLLGRLLTKSDLPERRMRGLDLLERLSKAGRGDAKAYLAIAVRQTEPVRARALLEQAMRGWSGTALPDLADMLIKGEGGPKDEKHAVKLLRAHTSPGGVAAISFALGQLYLEGRLVPRDPQEAARLMRTEIQWSVDATLQLAQLVIDNPSVTIDHPKGFLYTLTVAAQLDEPEAMVTLIALKLSPSAQFADRTGGCKLAERAAAGGYQNAKAPLKACGVN